MNPVSKMRPIGSFFEASPELLLMTESVPPWERHGAVTYLQTGRQALAAIATVLERAGRDTLLVPSYLCESMIAAFSSDRWILRPYGVGQGVAIESESLLRVAGECDPERTAALTLAYFGDEPSKAHIRAVRELQTRGIPVIEDESHRVLGALNPLGDYGIGSLRKVLPVADGAYLRGLHETVNVRARPHRGWRAMDLKRAGALAQARKTFAVASATLEQEGEPVPAQVSERTIQTVRRLDYERMRNQRRENADTLRKYLAQGDRATVLSAADVPSHLLVQIKDARLAQIEMAKRDIYCAIHWPRPVRMSAVAWRQDLLSLPVDHRYNATDMQRIGRTLAEVLS